MGKASLRQQMLPPSPRHIFVSTAQQPFAVGRCAAESETSSYGMRFSACTSAPSNALHGTLRPRPKKKPRTRITTATSRKTLARLAERPATPPNPRSAAMSATTAKMMAQRNMRPLPRYKRCIDLFEQLRSRTFDLSRCSGNCLNGRRQGI